MMDLEQLYEKYFNYIYLRCYRMMQNREKAEEMTQEVFIKAGKSLKRFVPFASHKSWLYKIATNCCLNEIAKLSNKREHVAKDDQALLLEQESENQDDPHSQIEIADFLNKKLNSEERELFTYKYIDQMTHDEIAQLLKVTKRTIINRTQVLKNKFKEWYYESQD